MEVTNDKKNKHRCALGVCPHAAPTIFNRTKTMNTKDLIRLGVLSRPSTNLL